MLSHKGQQDADCCQKVAYYRTIGVWTGKDLQDNVQANMAKLNPKPLLDHHYNIHYTLLLLYYYLLLW